MAPELFNETNTPLPTEASDVYALAMTFLSIITFRPPFSEYAHDFGASFACQKGMRPNKPKEVMGLTQPQADSLWVFIVLMWHQEPSERPRGTDVYEHVRSKVRNRGSSVLLNGSTVIHTRSRARTMSSSRRRDLSVDAGGKINGPPTRDPFSRARVSSAPPRPQLATLTE